MKTIKEVEQALDRLDTEWRTCRNFKEEETVQSRMRSVYLAWFSSLNMPATLEGKLRKKYKKLEQTTHSQTKIIEFFEKNNIVEVFEKVGWSKPQRAAVVYNLISTYPKDNVAQWCVAYGLSPGYYRELRSLNLGVWKAEQAEREDASFCEMMYQANNPAITDQVWIELYGSGFPREIFRLKMLTAASMIQIETPTNPEENQAIATNNIPNQSTKASV